MPSLSSVSFLYNSLTSSGSCLLRLSNFFDRIGLSAKSKSAMDMTGLLDLALEVLIDLAWANAEDADRVTRARLVGLGVSSS